MEASPTPFCADCGPAQISHSLLWVTSTGDVLTFWLPAHRLPFYGLLTRLGDVAAGYLGRVGFFIGRALGFITLSSDMEKAATRRSKNMWREAERRGVPMEQVLFSGKPTDTFRVKIGNRYEFFKSLPLHAVSGKALSMDDKIWFKRMMREAGLPVPKSIGVSDMQGAKKALDELGVVCVKPRSGSNGRHTFPYVTTAADMEKALGRVKQICAFASVEEQLEGNLARATCVGGKLIGFLESKYPTVVGDGVSTIEELVAKANAQKLDGVDDIELTDSTKGYLERRGYALNAVLPEGFALPLTYRAGAGQGGSNREYGRAIHPSFIEPIERAARLTELPIVGFDLIIPDPLMPSDGQKWGFIEANSLPWIDLHAAPFYGEPIDLSPAVWDEWLKSMPNPVPDTRS